MNYPEIPDFHHLANGLAEYSRLAHEYGAENIQVVLEEAYRNMRASVDKLQNLAIDPILAAKEPNRLDQIHLLRPAGPRRIWQAFDEASYLEKLEGAMLARFAGCTLGAIVEFWSIENMEKWAAHIGDAFPPVDYWSGIKDPDALRYGKSPCSAYTRNGMDGVAVDDDITYTVLGLLITEDHGIDFTVDDVAKAWLKYLPYACTAEEIALNNLKKGIPAREAADLDNPCCQWIGADIRSDPWAYIAPAYPEKAAAMAYHDAYLSHRRNGIYGEMFFSAAQSAAFAVDNAIDALQIGLSEIPSDCLLARDVRWALQEGKNIRNYKQARQAVEDKFKGMSGVHTNNNACLTIFGLMIGGNDVTKVLSETVAMGLDNDCTTATAGSIVGAIVGKNGIPAHWTKNFNNKVMTYMNDREQFQIDDLVVRFAAQARKVYGR
jgi:ADP-ribosylglycohydrolase